MGAATALALILTSCGGSSGGSANPAVTDNGPITALAGDGDDGGGSGSGGQTSGGGQTPGGNQQAGEPSPTVTPTLSSSETDGDCPYLSAQEAADLEGNRVGRTTVLSTTPPGCRFYFAYDLSHMTMEITTQTFDDPIDANNAMVTTATAGKNATAAAGIGDGAVLYQTTFYPPDGDNDWACAFIKGNVLVIIKTDQISPSYNARHVAETVAPRI